MPRHNRPEIGAREAVTLALKFMEGMRDAGASSEAMVAAFVTHLAREGFVVRRRVSGEGTRPRQPKEGGAGITGAEVRTARALLGLSIAKMATAAGVGRDTLRDFEHGRKVPQARTLAKLSVALEDLRRRDDRSR